MEIDGEPFLLGPCQITITRKNQARMIITERSQAAQQLQSTRLWNYRMIWFSFFTIASQLSESFRIDECELKSINHFIVSIFILLYGILFLYSFACIFFFYNEYLNVCVCAILIILYFIFSLFEKCLVWIWIFLHGCFFLLLRSSYLKWKIK